MKPTPPPLQMGDWVLLDEPWSHSGPRLVVVTPKVMGRARGDWKERILEVRGERDGQPFVWR
jgi:hypothetical protein